MQRKYISHLFFSSFSTHFTQFQFKNQQKKQYLEQIYVGHIQI